MNAGPLEEFEGDLAVEEQQPELKMPSMYKVLLLNDDYTPMDFVVEVLKLFFAMNGDKAAGIMWEVHTKGYGICGVFTRDIAETKVALVNDYAREQEHPLLCAMEADD